MARKNKKILVSCLFLFGILYFSLVKEIIDIDTNYRIGHYMSKGEFLFYFLPRIPLYVLNFSIFIVYFIACLSYLKKRKTGYIFSFVTLFLVFLCIRYDLPISPRNLSPERKIWQNDVIEYLFPMVLMEMFIFLLFLPVIYDLLKRYRAGKKVLIAFMAVEALGMDIVSTINMIFIGMESRYFDDLIPRFLWILLTKIMILFCILKLIIQKEDLLAEYSQRNRRRDTLQWIIPVFVVVLVFVVKVDVKGKYFIVPRMAQIDGYWYLGSVEEFIKQYENPYQDKRVYLEPELVGEEEAEEPIQTVDWTYYEKKDLLVITTYERKLESFYYMKPYSEAECNSSNLHSFELTKRKKIDAGKRNGKEGAQYRAVLSEKVIENTVFTYNIETDLKYLPVYWFPSDEFGIGYACKLKRDIEKYDILVQGKEIPAYFLGMVDRYGIVKVEPYTHFWGENIFECWKSNIMKLQAARQY